MIARAGLRTWLLLFIRFLLSPLQCLNPLCYCPHSLSMFHWHCKILSTCLNYNNEFIQCEVEWQVESCNFLFKRACPSYIFRFPHTQKKKGGKILTVLLRKPSIRYLYIDKETERLKKYRLRLSWEIKQSISALSSRLTFYISVYTRVKSNIRLPRQILLSGLQKLVVRLLLDWNRL